MLPAGCTGEEHTLTLLKHTFCMQCQISALWQEMYGQQKRATQLQLAVEDAHAEQFKEELIQTQVSVYSPQ